MCCSPYFFSGCVSYVILVLVRTLLAVSAWNDNGQTQFVHDSEVLYRSDFFPGLGWMLTKAVWDELAPQWPNAYPFSTVVYLLFIQKL
jgi:hypothetical protein